MQKLILVRYGEWENGHINAMGRQTVTAAAQRLVTALRDDGFSPGITHKICVISAEVPRAIESARLLADGLGLASTTSLPQLYAAEEDGRQPDPAAALQAIRGLEHAYGREYPIVVAVVSREYIETLPAYILSEVFGQPVLPHDTPALERGQGLAIDWATQSIDRI